MKLLLRDESNGSPFSWLFPRASLLIIVVKVFGKLLGGFPPPVDFVPAKIMEQGTWRRLQQRVCPDDDDYHADD